VGALICANIQYRTVEILLDGLINVSRQGAFSNSYLFRGHSRKFTIPQSPSELEYSSYGHDPPRHCHGMRSETVHASCDRIAQQVLGPEV
jgi:hypothetical protein